MATFTNTSITDNGQFTFPVTNTYSRPGLVTTVTQFTTVGTTSWTAPAGVTTIEVLVVAGGGGGGGGFDTWAGGGGGGAGGVIYRSAYPVTPNNSYTVIVGDGGTGGVGSSPRVGTNGSNSVFDTLTAIGGGGGGGWLGAPSASNAASGGSGGGGANASGGFLGAAGTANQGFAGGNGMLYTGSNASSGGGGGGAGGVGGSPGGNTGGGGGYGLWFNITGTPQVYAVGGGGGGGVTGGGAGPGLTGTGGRGGNGAGSSGTAGTPNTGSGGGGGGSTAGTGGNAATNGGKGGSGIVVVRYTIATDNTNPIGQIRYNKDASDIEVYDNPLVGWVAQDQTKNFAGHNLVTYSEQADNAAWTKSNCSITANAVAAPDGTVTADKIVENTAASVNHYILQGFTVPANSVWCGSVFVKAAGRTRLRLAYSTYTSWVGGGGCETQFDLSSQTITPKSSTPTGYGIADAGNGWYRIYITGTNNNTATGSNFVIYTENSSDYVYTGDGASGIYVWGMQLERDVLTPGPYTRTVDNISPLPGTTNGWRIHTYTSTGTSSFAPALTGNVELLVVGGGGSCGVDVGGGGGAGGVVYHQNYPVESGKIYTVTVGAGVGAGNRTSGNNSQFGNVLALGGGAAGWYYDRQGYSGGSGGGTGGAGPNGSARLNSAAANPGEGTQGQGHRGGFRQGGFGGGGGGGAGGPGEDQYGYGARGGPGIAYEITGKLTWYGGGGGSGDSGGVTTIGYGGIGGGGDGDSRNAGTANLRVNGMPNTGGGGGGDGGWTQPGGGGSGIVVVRYRYNN